MQPGNSRGRPPFGGAPFGRTSRTPRKQKPQSIARAARLCATEANADSSSDAGRILARNDNRKIQEAFARPVFTCACLWILRRKILTRAASPLTILRRRILAAQLWHPMWMAQKALRRGRVQWPQRWRAQQTRRPWRGDIPRTRKCRRAARRLARLWRTRQR